MKTYEMFIEKESDGVFGIGLVDLPAIESDFIYLNKEKENVVKLSTDIKLETIDNDKRVVIGPILVPNQEIYREFTLDDGSIDKFNIIFSKETIKMVADKFMIYKNTSNITLQHQVKTNSIFVTEFWTKVDNEKDKSSFFNMNEPIGTLYGEMKILDDDIWNNYIKTGILKGFSIEGQFTMKEVSPLEKLQSQLKEKYSNLL